MIGLLQQLEMSSPNLNPNPSPNPNHNPRPIYGTYMTVGLTNPRINRPSDYRYTTHKTKLSKSLCHHVYVRSRNASLQYMQYSVKDDN